MAINKEELISENTVLYVDQVRKSYGKKRVLKNISFSIEKGKIVGFLGPNGCGKTTLVKLINGLMPVTDGVILVGGKKISKETKAMVSYLPERTYLNNWMKVKDILDFFEDLFEDFDRQRAEQMFSDMKIGLNEKLKNLSKGTKEKVQLVLVMSRQADLYILDEPIAGVDPAARSYIMKTILTNLPEESSLLIVTHLISDIETICDEVIFVNDGSVVLHEETEALREKYGKSIDAIFREEFRC
ncbi:MAG: ABC transporter ATP-binding protein [Peptostreptococcus sp.]|uniref:ABC transporter ATP-binding protein n=1 Tax=Peptostreptococcus TaxID=1257 RepID=UPI001CB10B10|nr:MULTISPECIES: ABC transporter ATP-binding protein [Peptostreptococcus]MBF1057272.1 ABC transporter ATP-binding protein [Peptostreptococcus sp.]